MPHSASQDCGSQSSCPCGRPLLTHASTGDPQTLRGRSGSISCGGVTVPFPWSCCTQGFVCALQASLAGMRFDFKCSCAPPTALLWLLLCPCCGYLFLVGSNILLLMVVQQLVAILVFSKEKMSAHPSTPPPGSGFLMGSVQGVPGDQREGGKARHLLTLIPSGRVAAGSSQCPTEHSPPLCLSCNLLYMLFRPVSSSGS